MGSVGASLTVPVFLLVLFGVFSLDVISCFSSVLNLVFILQL